MPGLDAAKVKADAKSAAITKQIATLSGGGDRRTPSRALRRSSSRPGVNQPFPVQVASLTPDSFRSVLNQALQG